MKTGNYKFNSMYFINTNVLCRWLNTFLLLSPVCWFYFWPHNKNYHCFDYKHKRRWFLHIKLKDTSFYIMQSNQNLECIYLVDYAHTVFRTKRLETNNTVVWFSVFFLHMTARVRKTVLTKTNFYEKST